MTKTVAGAKSVSIPEVGGELEATNPTQIEAVQTTASDTAAEKRTANLAKARKAKAAKALAQAAETEAANSKSRSFKSAMAEEMAADRHSFGDIKEVGRVVPTAEEYVKVEIPLADLFDHTHPGVQLNRHKFEPGKVYLLRGDVALEVKKRLAMFHDEQVRLLRPNADRKALSDVNRGSQWTSRGSNAVVPLGRLEDIPTASDEKIYTVDF
jgi:hypothetical protein